MSETAAVPGVRELIDSRLAGRSDDYVLALALEGGGMRGVVSGALLLALAETGIVRVFDRLYGTSSGSINLCYFAAGGSWDALSIYYDHLPKGFVNPGWLLHRPRLNMAYVSEEVMRTRVPLEPEALAGTRYDVRIALSDVDTMRPEIVRVSEVAGQVREYLMAGSWLPILAGGPYRLDGRRYLDGGLLSPDPLYPALAEGATHVLMVSTAPEGTPTDSSRATTAVLRRTLNRWNRGLGDVALQARDRWSADKLLLRTGRTVEVHGARVLRVQPPAGSHQVTRLTLDRARLLDGARIGYRTGHEVFGPPLPELYFALTPGLRRSAPVAGDRGR